MKAGPDLAMQFVKILYQTPVRKAELIYARPHVAMHGAKFQPSLVARAHSVNREGVGS